MSQHPLTAELTSEELHDRLMERVDALLPALRERADHTEELRRLPDETVADMHAAGLWRMLQPKRWGGLEVHPNTFFEAQIKIASACPSTAWVFGVVAVHSWQLALFAEQAQQDVWGDDDTVLISSSYAPTGKVKRVDGGFEISGRWSFSSGCDHCDWVFLGGFAPTDGGPPDMRTFLVPKSDYVIEDNWHTIGLKGTGSKDIVIASAFVPEHRTHKMSDGFKCDNPGNAVNDAPLFRIPFGQLFVRSVSTSAIGIASGALDFYREVTAVKVGAADGLKAAENPEAQLACARASSGLDQIRLVLHRNFDAMMDHAERGTSPTLEQRVAWRYDSSDTVQRCVEMVDTMFTACGARALFQSSPMQRYFRDVHAARAHYANRPDKPGQNLGRVMLGHRTQDWFI